MKYLDKIGNEIKAGDFIKYTGEDKLLQVYATEDGELGTDATNPLWIDTGRAVPCEYGVYPFNGSYNHKTDALTVDCIKEIEA